MDTLIIYDVAYIYIYNYYIYIYDIIEGEREISLDGYIWPCGPIGSMGPMGPWNQESGRRVGGPVAVGGPLVTRLIMGTYSQNHS